MRVMLILTSTIFNITLPENINVLFFCLIQYKLFRFLQFCVNFVNNKLNNKAISF